MIFRETPLAGAWVLEPERFADERGFFARTYCRRDFAERGLDPEIAQCSLSWNRHRGTLRALGLGRIGRTSEHEESPTLAGMLRKVRHLVKIESA